MEDSVSRGGGGGITLRNSQKYALKSGFWGIFDISREGGGGMN